MSNEPQPQSSSPNQDGVLDEEQSNLQFMKEQLEGATKQLKEATTTRQIRLDDRDFGSRRRDVSRGKPAPGRSRCKGQSFGIAFEDGTVETRRRRMESEKAKIEEDKFRIKWRCKFNSGKFNSDKFNSDKLSNKCDS